MTITQLRKLLQALEAIEENEQKSFEVQIVQYDDDMGSFGHRYTVRNVKVGDGYVALDSNEDQAG